MLFGLLLGEPPLAAQLLDERVIARQPLQLTIAEHVRAAVANMAEADLLARDQRGCEGGPHPGRGRILAGELVDARVRLHRHPAQIRLRRLIGCVAGLERGCGEARGDLARLRATHPVRNRKHRRAGEVGILVCAALTPGVGAVRALCYSQHVGNLAVMAGISQCGTSSSNLNSVSPILT